MAGWFGLALDETRARFRANLEVDGVPPFWEDRLYGPAGTFIPFKVGDVVFEGVNPCQRCVVPERNPWTGETGAAFNKQFAELRRRHLPRWADVSRFNHFYRLATNTRLAAGHKGNTVSVGEELKIVGSAAVQMPAAAARPKL